MLRQFLSEAQKTVFKSKYADDDSSTTAIYKDFVTTQMADSLAHGGGIGLAKTFQHQVTPHGAKNHGAKAAGETTGGQIISHS